MIQMRSGIHDQDLDPRLGSGSGQGPGSRIGLGARPSPRQLQVLQSLFIGNGSHAAAAGAAEFIGNGSHAAAAPRVQSCPGRVRHSSSPHSAPLRCSKISPNIPVLSHCPRMSNCAQTHSPAASNYTTRRHKVPHVFMDTESCSQHLLWAGASYSNYPLSVFHFSALQLKVTVKHPPPSGPSRMKLL